MFSTVLQLKVFFLKNDLKLNHNPIRSFVPKMSDLILASSSDIRASLLESAGLTIEVAPARLDEESIKASMTEAEAPPRDLADALAEAKAQKIANRFPNHRVLGCDQVLTFEGKTLSKPKSRDEAYNQLQSLRGKTHSLLSAAVLYEAQQPVWRHVSIARLTMRSFSEAYVDAYLDRNWPDVGSSVGGYKLESEGVRLFSQIQGDHFTILGLPLIPLLNHLSTNGNIPA